MRGQASFSEGLNVGMERLIDRRSRTWDDVRLDNLAPHRVVQSFWDDTHDDFKMAQQKYTTDMRLYALEGVAQK